MSMLLKALEGVERDRNRKAKEKKRGEAGAFEQAAPSAEPDSGDVDAVEALEYFMGSTKNEVTDKLALPTVSKAAEETNLEKLEFELDPGWDAGIEKKVVSDVKGSGAGLIASRALADDDENAEVVAEPTMVTSSGRDGLISSLANCSE